MLDAELVVYTLMQRGLIGDLAGLLVVPETDNQSLAKLPLVQFSTSGDGQSANGPALFQVTLDLNLFTEGIDAGRRFSGLLYDLVWSWMLPGLGVVAGAGAVSEVYDISTFSRVGTPELTGHGATQYAGS